MEVHQKEPLQIEVKALYILKIFKFKFFTFWFFSIKIQNSTLPIKIDHQSKTPERATSGSVGFDLFASEKVLLKAGTRISIDTGLQVEFPKGTFGLLKERSSFAKNYGIIVLGGVIDNDYRGRIQVTLFNLGEKDFMIEKEMKFAQLLCLKYEALKIKHSDILFDTERNDKGHGSSGLFWNKPIYHTPFKYMKKK